MMRLLLVTAVLLGGGLFGYASLTRVSAQGQSIQAGITQGERLRLRFDPVKSGYECNVIEVRGDFVGCKGPESSSAFQSTPDRWYNLRLVAVIERPLKQD